MNLESNKQSSKSYIVNTGWLLFEKGARFLVQFFIWAMVIRYLGPKQFGTLSYALSYVALFGMLADCGVEVILVKDLIENPSRRSLIMGSAFVLRILGALAAVVLIFLSFFVLHVEPMTKLIISLVSLRLFFVAFNNIDSFFQSRVLSRYTVYSQLIALAVTSIMCTWFVATQKPLIDFVWIAFLETAVAALGFIFFYQKVHGERWQIDRSIMKDLLARSWTLVISAFAIMVYMRLDQIMIKHILGDAAVGQFAVAVRVSEAFYFIPMAITTSLFPAIVQAKMMGEAVYHERLRTLNSFLIWIALGVTLVFSICGKDLIQIFFGAQYAPASGVLMIHIWASVFVFLGVLRSKWAINEQAQNLVMIYTVIGAVINIVLNLFWIPLWGINGAAFATVVAQCFAAILSNLLHRKTRSMFFVQMQAFNPIYLLRQKWQS